MDIDLIETIIKNCSQKIKIILTNKTTTCIAKLFQYEISLGYYLNNVLFFMIFIDPPSRKKSYLYLCNYDIRNLIYMCKI